MKKRILVLLSVVALMVVMLAMSVAPAFAGWAPSGCKFGDFLIVNPPPGSEAASVNGERTADSFVCQSLPVTKKGPKYYDNREPTITIP
jgi:hypothetical protein